LQPPFLHAAQLNQPGEEESDQETFAKDEAALAALVRFRKFQKKEEKV